MKKFIYIFAFVIIYAGSGFTQQNDAVDGERIIFSSNRDGKNGTFYMMKTAGLDIKRVPEVKALYARLSPDRKKLVFISGSFPRPDVFIAGADGSNQNSLKINAHTRDDSSQSPVSTVIAYLEAMKAMNPERMNDQVADDYTIVSTDGSERLYKKELAYPITDWERGMNTKWSYQIVGVNGNQVTVIVTEKSDYFTLLGLEMRTQVSEYTVKDGKILKSLNRVVVEGRGTQSEAYGKFKSWLLSQANLSEPDLIDKDQNLTFTGKSSPRMLYWLKKWDQSQKNQQFR